ncbi:MAG: hypothetical protein K0S08_1964 [Gammaproteobacteria bacterium]|jgi:hypothetical protein|nr:hypothetical protein [Gammaproteobacteria bacterium]
MQLKGKAKILIAARKLALVNINDVIHVFLTAYATISTFAKTKHPFAAALISKKLAHRVRILNLCHLKKLFHALRFFSLVH